MIDAYQLGARVAQLAFRYSGACGCEPFRPRMREALGLSPTEWFDWRVFVSGKQGVSTCFMFAHNMWRMAGIAVPPWHVGDFVSTLRAAMPDIWQPWQDGCEPSTGDLIVLGPRAKGGTHVAIVTSFDGVTLESIDGGQVCRQTGPGHDGTGRQAIKMRKREWLGDGRVRGDRVDDVVGWFDVARARLR